MKKTYITPSVLVVDLNKEMPVLCTSGGLNNNLPQNDGEGFTNLFSTDRGIWNEDKWATSDDEDQY